MRAAIADLTQAVKLSPRNDQAITDLGAALGAADAFAESIKQLNLALEINPDNALALANRAFVLTHSVPASSSPGWSWLRMQQRMQAHGQAGALVDLLSTGSAPT